MEFSWGVFWAVLAALVVYRLLRRIHRKWKAVTWDSLASSLDIAVELLVAVAFFVGTIIIIYARFSDGLLHHWIYHK